MARIDDISDTPRALDDIKVVEIPAFDRIPMLGAAMATKSFADFGAEVIKVEPARTGAFERRLGPFRDELPDPETGGLHLFLNTNKLGVTLDLERPRAQQMLFAMLENADIVLNPNRASVNARLGIEWRTLVKRFPRLIAVSVTSFPIDSSYGDLEGGDLVATQMSGVGFETPWNQVTNLKNEPPLKLGGRQADYLAGYTAAASAMCAWFARKRTGLGQHVETSYWLAMASMIRPDFGIYSHEAENSPGFVRLKTREKAGVPWVYPAADGWVSFSAATERFWQGAKIAMNNPEWMQAEALSTPLGRIANLDAIEAGVMDWLSNITRDEAFKRAQAQHVPCFPVSTPTEVAENPQYKHRKFFVDHEHPAAREVTMPGAPCLMTLTPWRIVRGAPRIGEHNQAIFGKRLGIADSELARLREEGTI